MTSACFWSCFPISDQLPLVARLEQEELQKTCFLKSSEKELLVDYKGQWFEQGCKTEDSLSQMGIVKSITLNERE